LNVDGKVVDTSSEDLFIECWPLKPGVNNLKTALGSEILLSIHGNALPDGVDPAGSKGAGGYYSHPQARGLAETILESLTKGVPGLGNDGVITRTSR
jgi:N-acetylmuramoyl-L-alanine amidase